YNWYASETFALYNQLAPTLFTLVGVENKELGTTAGHHTAAFDIDEDALQYGVGAMVDFAVNY
ncbi:MAG: amidohydrolase, partial [Prevotella sp.]|nr:amidohydrolase [Prevotella sp.]